MFAFVGWLGISLGLFFVVGAIVVLVLWLNSQPPIEFNKHNPTIPDHPVSKDGWAPVVDDIPPLIPFQYPQPVPEPALEDDEIMDHPPTVDQEPILDEIPEDPPEKEYPPQTDEKFLPPAEFTPSADDFDTLDTSDDGGSDD